MIKTRARDDLVAERFEGYATNAFCLVRKEMCNVQLEQEVVPVEAELVLHRNCHAEFNR